MKLHALLVLAIPLFFFSTAWAQDPPKTETPAEPEKKAETPKAEDKKDAKPEEKPAVTPKYKAFVGGEVWTVSGPRISGGTVLVKDDKIVLVGDSVEIPKDAEVIDCKGRHVCPGFVALATRGILGVRGNTTKEKAKDRFDPWAEFMLMALGSGITTAHQGPGVVNEFFGDPSGQSGTFSGTPRGLVGGVIAKLSYGQLEGYEVRDPAGVFLGLPQRSSGTLAELREGLERAKEHREKRRQWLKDLAAGKKDATEPKGEEVLDALVRALDGELPVFFKADRRNEFDVAFEICDRYKLPLIVHAGLEAWTMVDEIGRRPIALALCPRGLGGRGTRPYRDERRDAPHGFTIENAAIASRAGIPWVSTTLSTGVVTGLLGGRDALGLPFEAAFAVRGGASEELALRSITLTPAEFLKIDHRLGSLTPGKDADILVLDRDPLDYRAFVELTYVNGRLVYDRKVVPFWSHVPTNREDPPGPWKPYGIWGELPDGEAGKKKVSGDANGNGKEK